MPKLETILVRFLLSALLYPTLAGAQDQAPKPQAAGSAPDTPLQTRAFQLGRVRVDEAMEVIQRIYKSAKSAPVERTNTVVVRDTPETLDQIAVLLKELETQPDADHESADSAAVHTFRLQRRSAEQVAELLQEVFHTSRIVAEPDSNTLIVKASPDELAKINGVVLELEREKDSLGVKTLRLTFDLIRAATGSKEMGTLPDDLKEVGDELVKSGLGDLKPYGHLMALARDGGKFEAYYGRARTSDDGKGPVPGIRIEGDVNLLYAGRKEPVAQIHLKSWINLPIAGDHQADKPQPIGPRSDENFGITTTTTTPLGHYVVLGTFPLIGSGSDTILLVIRVTAD